MSVLACPRARRSQIELRSSLGSIKRLASMEADPRAHNTRAISFLRRLSLVCNSIQWEPRVISIEPPEPPRKDPKDYFDNARGARALLSSTLAATCSITTSSCGEKEDATIRIGRIVKDFYTPCLCFVLDVNKHISSISHRANKRPVAIVVETKPPLSLGSSQAGKIRCLRCLARSQRQRSHICYLVGASIQIL
jgi:hypothetical protein